jgi:hypothetical protein
VRTYRITLVVNNSFGRYRQRTVTVAVPAGPASTIRDVLRRVTTVQVAADGTAAPAGMLPEGAPPVAWYDEWRYVSHRIVRGGP